MERKFKLCARSGLLVLFPVVYMYTLHIYVAYRTSQLAMSVSEMQVTRQMSSSHATNYRC